MAHRNPLLTRTLTASGILAAVTGLGLSACGDADSDIFVPENPALQTTFQNQPVYTQVPLNPGCPPPDVLDAGDARVVDGTGVVVPYVDTGDEASGANVSGNVYTATPTWIVFNDKTITKPEGGKTNLAVTRADGTLVDANGNPVATFDEALKCPDFQRDPATGALVRDGNGNPVPNGSRFYPYIRSIGRTTDGAQRVDENGVLLEPEAETCFGGAIQLSIGPAASASDPEQWERIHPVDVGCLASKAEWEAAYAARPDEFLLYDNSLIESPARDPQTGDCIDPATGAPAPERESKGLTFIAVARRETTVRIDLPTLRSEPRSRPIFGEDSNGDGVPDPIGGSDPRFSSKFAFCRDFPPNTPACELEALWEDPELAPKLADIGFSNLPTCDDSGGCSAGLTCDLTLGDTREDGTKTGRCLLDPCKEGFPTRDDPLTPENEATPPLIAECGLNPADDTPYKPCQSDSDCPLFDAASGQAGLYCDTDLGACRADCTKANAAEFCGGGRSCSDRGQCFFDTDNCARKRLEEYVPEGAEIGGLCPRPFNVPEQDPGDQPFLDLFDVTDGCDDHFHMEITVDRVWRRFRIPWKLLQQRGFGRDQHCYPIDTPVGQEQRYSCGFDPREFLGMTVGVDIFQPDYEVYFSDIRFY